MRASGDCVQHMKSCCTALKNILQMRGCAGSGDIIVCNWVSQVAEVTELRGTTTRQDAEVRQLRAQNQQLAQKAALVEVLSAEVAALKTQVHEVLL